MSSTSDDWPIEAIPREWIDKLWLKMRTYYGNKLADLWMGQDTEAVKREWGIALAKLTPDQVRRGVEALQHQDWPPTLPMFIGLCQPPIEPVKAYYEAVAGLQARSYGEVGRWSHPAIFWAAARMSHDLRSCSFSQIRDRWEVTLKDELAKGSWGKIETPALQITNAVSQRAPSEHNAHMLDALHKLVSANPGTHPDPKAWAHKIIERAKDPKQGITQAVLYIAQDALKKP